MNSEGVHLSEGARARLDTYLDAIGDVLSKTELPRSNRRGIADDVEAQVHEMLLHSTQGEIALDEMERVLSQLDPPEAYADAGQERAPTTEGSLSVSEQSIATPHYRGPARISRPAVIGALWAAVFPIALFGMFYARVVSPDYEPSFFERVILPIVGVAITLVGGTAILGTTVLGMVSVSQIRHSAGRICGLPLAVFDSLLFPLLIIDGLIIFASHHFMMFLAKVKLRSNQMFITGLTPEEWNWVWVIAIPLIVIVDLFFIWRAWKVASKPVG